MKESLERIVVGMPVILNDMDRPCTRLVAIVKSIEQPNTVSSGIVHARYLTTNTMMKDCSSLLAHTTPLEAFGVELVIVGSQVYGHIIGPSQATYRNGKPREWQPEHCEIHDIDPHAFELMRAAGYLTPINL